VEWDRIVRGRGKTNVGAPQGSPLSRVIFLIWMAPIIEKMDQETRRVWPTLEMELPSYVNDLHLEVHATTREQAKSLDMMTVLNSVDRINNVMGVLLSLSCGTPKKIGWPVVTYPAMRIFGTPNKSLRNKVQY